MLGAIPDNWVFVPVVSPISRAVLRPFGWHIVIKAIKAIK
jgi:hypothetical protein